MIPILTVVMLLAFLGTGRCDENNCNDCALSEGVYACLDEFNYGVCYNTGSVDPGSVRTCPNSYYCNTDGGDFCSPVDSTSPSCVPVTTTTKAPETNPDKYCADLNKTGYFRLESDPTCKDYVYCYKLSGEIMGWLYHCNTNEFYDSKSRRCETTRPNDC
ncbi:hypothetical protein ACLKA6_011760 [Drosophila palustris]